MNALWQHTGYLTKCSLDSFPGIRDQKVLPRFMRQLGVAFSGNHQIYICCLTAYLLIVVISICAITVYNAIFRQIKEHVFHSINIVITSRKHRKFNWYSIHCCNYLNCEPIEVIRRMTHESRKIQFFPSLCRISSFHILVNSRSISSSDFPLVSGNRL